jgi:dolichol-phosphate mannosyltransferase
MHHLSIVIPCCNEEAAVQLLPERLFPVLRRLSAQFAIELILVDDGSADDTWKRLEELRAMPAPWTTRLARHPANRGVGTALRTGQALASGQIVATVDADGTYPFTLLEPLVHAVEAGADIASVSPYHARGGVNGVSALRLLFSRGASLCYRLLVDRHIATYTAMVRAYRAEILAAALAEEAGFLSMAMTLIEARRRGARVVEVPAVLAGRQVGVSKARVARMTRRHLRYMGHLLVLRAGGHFWLRNATGVGRERREPPPNGRPTQVTHQAGVTGGHELLEPAQRG